MNRMSAPAMSRFARNHMNPTTVIAYALTWGAFAFAWATAS